MSRVPPRVHARGGSRESRGRERGNGSRCEAPPLTLSQAEPQRADVVVTMLHRDADNLAVAALSRSLGAKRVMVRMRDPLYRPVYEAAGVQQILSETEVLVGAFATAIEFEAVRHSMVLGSGSIAIELKVPSHARVVGGSVSDLANDPGFPRSCVIAGIALDGAVQAPRGATVIEAGAELLVISARTDLTTAIAMFLESAPTAAAEPGRPR